MSELDYLTLAKVDAKFCESYPERLRNVAYGIQRVMRIAYERAFEQQRQEQRLPPGTIKECLFDEDDPERIEMQVERLIDHTFQGNSVYTLAYQGDVMLGLAKASPSTFLGVRLPNIPPNAYINDVAVVSDGHGLGSLLMNKALEDYDAKRQAVLDAYEGNDVANKWFGRLGFVPTGKRSEFKIGSFVVPQVEMQASSVGAIQARLASS